MLFILKNKNGIKKTLFWKEYIHTKYMVKSEKVLKITGDYRYPVKFKYFDLTTKHLPFTKA
jgi:hypothetical protein